MKVVKSIEKFPGGLMVIPLFLAAAINTFFPELLQIGGFTSGLLSKTGQATFVGLFLFTSGAAISFKQVGLPVYKGSVLTVTKVAIGVAVGVIIGKIFGNEGIFGITPLAIIAALTNCASVMYAILASQVGDSTDVGAVALLGLDDGPFYTMIALGAAGMATIPLIDLVAVIVPILLGIILGNMDEDIREMCEKATPLIIPFNGFVLGAGLNLSTIVKAGIPGIVLGLISLLVSGFACYWVYNLFFGRKKRTAVGMGMGNTAGTAVITPAAIGSSDPVWAPFVAGATAQIAAAAVVTYVLCPLLTLYMHKRIQRKYNEQVSEVAAS